MDEVIRYVALKHKHDDILREAHDGIADGHFSEDLIRKSIIR